jgi:hypothetical protein
MNTSIEKFNSHDRTMNLKMRLSKLTDDDLMFADGLKTEIFGHHWNKPAKNKSQMLRIRTAI